MQRLSLPKEMPCIGSVFECTESRYVIKAKVVTEVIEHKSLKAINCPKGSNVKPGEFPSNVKAYVQYNDSIAILAGLLNTKGAVSLIRVQELLRQLFLYLLARVTTFLLKICHFFDVRLEPNFL